MKLALLITILIATGAVTYVAQASYPGEVLYPIKVGVNENVGTIIAVDPKTKAEMQAEIFAERLEEVDQLLATGALTNANAEKIRGEIADQFDEAFGLITELEKQGDLAKASVARAIMQNAIDYHMRQDEEASQRLSRDLSVYSKIMTESLIARSTQ